MMLTFDAPTTTVISAGLYPAALANVQVAEGVTGPYLVWRFEINTEGAEIVLPLPTSTKVGPGTAARRLIETLLGRRVTEDETIAVGMLQGAPCQILVTVVHRDGSGPANKIASVIPASGSEVSESDVPF
jgi:hypothetical protein